MNPDHIHTLHEFMVSTKAVCYLVGLLYLVAFPLFWRFLGSRDREDDKRHPFPKQ